MAIRVTWRCTKPNLGLREAMARMAEEIAYEGEYSEVEILSTTKTTSGGKKVAPHFKVRLLGRSNGYDVAHSHLIKVEHRDGNRNPWRFQMTGRPSNYDYDTTSKE
ncbi:hypothetical protein BJ875DRAFT_464884 [Amylocarpus encephaloides]|uniref:Uncharacterized protein n=1 Tax=Amylocarpus encephaloides TaxID=45428 RepID=A0A9P7YGH6_9HELO|nr:hypothetical protein BJ875DRAFT_464884 [Amylocarpus encephaloides]